MDKVRVESDSLGSKEVPSESFWGAQTQRSIENFAIGWEKMPMAVIEALLYIKKAAALANKKLEILDENTCNLICVAIDEIQSGDLWGNFSLRVWQTGSGTQTNMNVNEVISNIAIKNSGGQLGSKAPVHPNDHVNKSQSSNDSFPTAMRIAIVSEVEEKLFPALENFINILASKIKEFEGIVKIGRTHLQDATPLLVSQEFSAFLTQIEHAKERLSSSLSYLFMLPQGGTAVGTGLNAPKDFSEHFIQELRKITGKSFISCLNKFEAIATHDSLVHFSGNLNSLAVSLMKISSDIRFLGSGPRCGIGELTLPENEPGSSIMPGKVNPTQCEALSMVCAQVMGNHTTVSIAGSNGHMQLNAFKPVIIYNILQSVQLLSDSCNSFVKNCLIGLQVNKQKIDHMLQNSLMLVTALVPHIGYDNAAKIAKNAHKKNLSLRESGIELQIITGEEFDKIVDPKKMINS